MTNFLIVGLTGFVGAISRYLVYLWFAGRNLNSFPWATLTVNVLGCFAIGALSIFLEKMNSHQNELYLAASVGFLGAFTTFSAFGMETFNLFRSEQSYLALLNIGLNILLGLAAVGAGRFLLIKFY